MGRGGERCWLVGGGGGGGGDLGLQCKLGCSFVSSSVLDKLITKKIITF